MFSLILPIMLAGALGGAAARLFPGGLGKTELRDAPAEAGIIVCSLAGGFLGLLALLQRDAALLITDPMPAASFGDLAWAVGIGLGAVKWLRNSQDNQTLRQALADAAQKEPDPELSRDAASQPPRMLLRRARRS